MIYAFSLLQGELNQERSDRALEVLSTAAELQKNLAEIEKLLQDEQGN